MTQKTRITGHRKSFLAALICAASVAIALFAQMAGHVQVAGASQKGIMSFGMAKTQESFFYQEISLQERFNSGAFKDDDFSIETLAKSAVGKTYDGKEIDVRTSLNATQTAATQEGSVGQDLRQSAEVSKQAPSALYNPELAAGFEYGTQDEAAAGSQAAQSQSGVLSAGTLAGGSAATGITEWKRVFVSWYGPGFYGNHMANGEILKTDSMILAHKTLPFGTKVEIKYNGKSVVGVVKDRGPFIPGREFDLGPGIAKALGFSGVHFVYYRIVE